MFGKRPNPMPEDKRLRCTITVRVASGRIVPCGRLAKKFAVTKYEHDLGTLCLCQNHASMHRKLDYVLTAIDRRRKVGA